jgi:hypothetical protein
VHYNCVMLKQRIFCNKSELFDPIRKKWVPKTEEEVVRQLFILFLIEEKKIPASHISVEKEIKVNGLSRRYDLVVYGQTGKPDMVIECKAPHIEISQEVMEQAGRYNKTLKAPVIGVTNGTVHRFFKINFETDEIILLV